MIVGECRVHNNLEDLVAFHKTVKDGEREGVCVCVIVGESIVHNNLEDLVAFHKTVRAGEVREGWSVYRCAYVRVCACMCHVCVFMCVCVCTWCVCV